MANHVSIQLNTPCEFINVEPVNPLISKCQIKVCYVGDEPNRNGSIISKEVAAKMANSLPGSPIVGFYNEETKDFEEHNKEIYFEGDKIKFKDTTRPYGFVDLGAKCWFQKFVDDGVEHEYLMTEGYLWTGQFPEAQRVIDAGNNQSMELDPKHTSAVWATLDNNKGKFFIINETVISKLCILGKDYEPCFEGATIEKMKFSFDDGFNNQIFSMMKIVTDYINQKGGEIMPNEENILVTDEDINVEDEEFKKKKEEDIKEDEQPQDKGGNEEKDTEDNEDSADEEKDTEEDNIEDEDKTDNEENDKKKKKAKYVLEEVTEYTELLANYSALETERNALQETINSLNAEIDSLKQFKHDVEKTKKQEMIDSFYMLSDEDKKDVIDHIEEYSLDDIEAKLSVICVRNKVQFDLDKDEEDTFTFNLNNEEADDSLPAWVKAVLETSKNLN